MEADCIDDSYDEGEGEDLENQMEETLLQRDLETLKRVFRVITRHCGH